MIEVIRRKESVAARFLEKQNIPFSFNLQNKMKEICHGDNEKKMSKHVLIFSFSVK